MCNVNFETDAIVGVCGVGRTLLRKFGLVLVLQKVLSGLGIT